MTCFLFLNGCMTTQNLLSTDRYMQENVPNRQTSIREVWAIEYNGGLRVFGRLRVNATGLNVPGYVEVALLDEDRKIIEKQKVAYYPKVLTDRKIRRRGAKFIADFSEAPPQGTIIQLSNVN